MILLDVVCFSLDSEQQDIVILHDILCFSLDPEQREQLIELMEKLLGDKTTVSGQSDRESDRESDTQRVTERESDRE